MPELPIIKVNKKSGGESFHYNGKQQKNTSLLDFWRWTTSDLISNTIRGVLAEFIVALACDLHRHIRSEWDAFDLTFEGIRIEVKSAAYVQSWFQDNYSKIIFNVKPTLAWDYETNKQATVAKRQSDMYVFCLLETKDQDKINPLDLNQWIFYVCSTTRIEQNCPEAKSLSLKKLKQVGAIECRYPRIKRYIREEYNS